MKYMRIVAVNWKDIFVQTSDNRRRDYKQVTMSHEEFEEFMKANFASYWNEYESSGSKDSAAEYFYTYGETEEMKRKGIAYIYEA